MARLMLDPSFALRGQALRWLEDEPASRGGVVLSEAFVEHVSAEEVTRRYQPFFSSHPAARRRDRFAVLTREIATFSHRNVELDDKAEAVRLALLDDPQPDAEILADEWAFLNSESWLAAAMRRPLDAFRDAGATIVEYGRRLRDELVEGVVPSEDVPGVLTVDFLARVSVKWLILGGIAAGSVPILGPTGGALASLASSPVVRAFDA